LFPSSHDTSGRQLRLARLSAMGDPVTDELLRLRMSIDNMDAALVHLLAERFKVTQQVGELKAAHGMPPADPVREAEQIARLRALAEDARLDPEFAEKFLNFVVAEVVRHHQAALNRRDSDM
jgi:chorismate mutase